MITQVHSYKPIAYRVESNKFYVVANIVDKGKHKVVGIQINEPVNISKNTLRDAFKTIVNIENNRRPPINLGRRDDPKFFNPRSNKKDGDKLVNNKKSEGDKMD